MRKKRENGLAITRKLGGIGLSAEMADTTAFITFLKACKSRDPTNVAAQFAPHMSAYLESTPGRSVQQDCEGAISSCGGYDSIREETVSAEPCEDPNLYVYSINAQYAGREGLIKCNGTGFYNGLNQLN